jgi:CHASE3 domain sensor protein
MAQGWNHQVTKMTSTLILIRLNNNMRSLIQTFCLLCFLATLGSTYQFIDTIKLMDRAKILDAAAHTLLVSLLNAETGQRGYIITNDENYLAPYHSALAQIEVNISALQVATVGDPDQTKHVIEIILLTREKMKQLSKTVEIRTDQNLQAAAEEMKANLGKNIMDNIRTHIDSIELSATTSFLDSEDMATRYARIAFITMLLTLLSGSFITFNRW